MVMGRGPSNSFAGTLGICRPHGNFLRNLANPWTDFPGTDSCRESRSHPILNPSVVPNRRTSLVDSGRAVADIVEAFPSNWCTRGDTAHHQRRILLQIDAFTAAIRRDFGFS